MDSFSGVISNLIESFKDRIKNPLLGSILISWLVINWKPIYFVLFSSESISYRIQNYHDFQDFNSPWGIILPLIIALVYFLLVPWALAGLEWLALFGYKIQIDRKFAKRKVEIRGKTSIIKDEVDLEKKKSNFRELEQKNQRIEALENQLEEKSNQLTIKDEEVANLESKVTSLDLEVKNLKAEPVNISISREYQRLSKNHSLMKNLPSVAQKLPCDGVPDIPPAVLKQFEEENLIVTIDSRDGEANRYEFSPLGQGVWHLHLAELPNISLSNI